MAAVLDDLPALLAPLGFTELEALVYGELLRSPGLTGYALAKVTGKGQPSVYAALASLETKRAVFATDTGARSYAAVPVAELLTRLRRNHEQWFVQAEEALTRVQASTPPDSLVQLRNADQVYERAQQMIDAAQETILFELAPGCREALAPHIQSAAKRGLSASGLVMRAEDAIDGARSVVSPVGSRVLEVWPFDLLVLVTDARQVLIGGLSEDGAARALWTDSLFMSVILHNAIASDVLLHHSSGEDWTGPNLSLFGRHPPGFRELLSQRPPVLS